MHRKANTPPLAAAAEKTDLTSGADAHWPEPSPLASWWEEVMSEDADGGRIQQDIA